MRSRIAAVAAITIRKTARSLKNMRSFTCSSFRGLESVAGAAHGLQITRVLGVGLDFFADATNVDVDRARSDVGGVAPDGIEQMVATENAPRMAGEVVEQAELGGGGGNRIAAHGEGHGR